VGHCLNSVRAVLKASAYPNANPNLTLNLIFTLALPNSLSK